MFRRSVGLDYCTVSTHRFRDVPDLAAYPQTTGSDCVVAPYVCQGSEHKRTQSGWYVRWAAGGEGGGSGVRTS